MSTLEFVQGPVSPASDASSCVFEDGLSSEGVPSPDEPVLHISLAQRSANAPYNAAKGIASAGLAVHSPSAIFVGTPFATGPAPLFEYPFPKPPSSRPALSNASSLSSVTSSLHGPPSPSTRSKLHPHPFIRLASGHTSSGAPVRRRFSGGNGPPPIRVPPRLRTDSSSSVASSVVDEPTITSTITPTSAPGPSTSSFNLHPNSPTPPLTRSSPLLRLRNRSGSLGVLPIQLPRPSSHPSAPSVNSTPPPPTLAAWRPLRWSWARWPRLGLVCRWG